MPLSTSLLVIKLNFTLPGLILCEAVKFLAGELSTVEPIIVEFLKEESIVKFVSGVPIELEFLKGVSTIELDILQLKTVEEVELELLFVNIVGKTHCDVKVMEFISELLLDSFSFEVVVILFMEFLDIFFNF